jgi:hypothetical protein
MISDLRRRQRELHSGNRPWPSFAFSAFSRGICAVDIDQNGHAIAPVVELDRTADVTDQHVSAIPHASRVFWK